MKTKIFILLASALTLFACQNRDQQNSTPESEESKIINILMSQCKDFNTNTLAQDLTGEWNLDSQLYYDEAWQIIVECHMLRGQWQPNYNIGAPDIKRYTFAPGGKGLYYVYSSSNGSELGEHSASFDWYYNAENRELVVSGEHSSQFIVSGFNNEYLVLDWVNAKGNLREVFKRKVE